MLSIGHSTRPYRVTISSIRKTVDERLKGLLTPNLHLLERFRTENSFLNGVLDAKCWIEEVFGRWHIGCFEANEVLASNIGCKKDFSRSNAL